jgi:isoleucyl-tRNA synthetase
VEVIKRGIYGRDLVGKVSYNNPFNRANRQPIIQANFVTEDMGTGSVHIAPGHGLDDYHAAKVHGIAAFAPVDERGLFTAEALPSNPEVLVGKSVADGGSQAVISYLRKLQNSRPEGNRELIVVATHKLVHKYPIDWRTKQPVIIRATDQWFADIDSIKGAALSALDSVKFIPESGEARLRSFVSSRSQWCISRQRAWGLPIPALYRTDVDPAEAVMTGETIDHIMKTIEKRGIEAWWSDSETEAAWIPPGLKGTYVRGKDTMDVWFDSGISWFIQNSTDPVNVYLEGTDQHRGWFQSSLLTSIAYQKAKNPDRSPQAPFKKLITHGFTLDSQGRKMSKSIGNTILPEEVTSGKLLPPLKQRKSKEQSPTTPLYDGLGTDVLRYLVASVDYTKDLSISPAMLKPIQSSLRKMRMTFKWLLGALSSYNPTDRTSPTQSSTPLIDTIALHSLGKVSAQVHTALTSYSFVHATAAINAYVFQDLSAFYFETLKDRLYAGGSPDRRAAQSVLAQIYYQILVMLAPITPLMVEEVWTLTPAPLKETIKHPLQQIFTPFSSPPPQDQRYTPAELDVLYAHLTSAKRLVGKIQEDKRAKGTMGSSLQSHVTLQLVSSASNEQAQRPSGRLAEELFVPGNSELLAAALVVSTVTVEAEKTGVRVELPAYNAIGLVGDDGRDTGYALVAQVDVPRGSKCDRCWRYLELTDHGICGRCEDVIREEHPDMLNSIEAKI